MKPTVTRLSLALIVAAIAGFSPMATIAVGPQTQDASEQSGQTPSDQKSSVNNGRGAGQNLQLGTQLVSITVTVTDIYGRFVTGLNRDHFEVQDDKIKQQIAHFSNEDAQVSLGIVYDVSGSM